VADRASYPLINLSFATHGQLGVHSGAGGTVRLAPLMGQCANTFEATLSGFGYDANTAERMGWINRALPDAELTGFVNRLGQATGQSNKEIGRRLFISEATVKAHIKSIFGKLNVLSRTEAVAAAARRGMVHL